MPSWPGSVPDKFEQRGFDYQDEDNLQRTQMGQGPDKVRVRFTAVSTLVSGNIRMSKSQYQDLLAFHRWTLMWGALTFDWVDPISGSSEVFRFLRPPWLVAVSADRVVVGVDLEMLP